jgi:hypothetical protein
VSGGSANSGPGWRRSPAVMAVVVALFLATGIGAAIGLATCVVERARERAGTTEPAVEAD